MEQFRIYFWYYISRGSIIEAVKILESEIVHTNVFATEKQAKSALAMAQLSQLMKAYNGDWEPDWRDNTIKYCIIRFEDKISCEPLYGRYHFLAFKTKELRDEFLNNFEDLIKQYFML